MRSALFAIAAMLWTGPLAAQTPMTAEEFEAYVTGQTLTFGFQGAPYGVEEFRPGRRTTWAFMGEECREGFWFPRGEQICFIYEDRPSEEHCWIFWRSEEGLGARFMGEEDGTVLHEAFRTNRPLQCPGPEVGV